MSNKARVVDGEEEDYRVSACIRRPFRHLQSSRKLRVVLYDKQKANLKFCGVLVKETRPNYKLISTTASIR